MGYNGSLWIHFINGPPSWTSSMTTERKPGSRGVTERFTKGPKTRDSGYGNARGNEPNESRKGSTKTKAPRKGFKKRRK